MPIHFDDLDVVSKAAGLSSALIVPCNMCPAATVAVREKKPFMQFFRSLLKSPPFEQYIRTLQSRLKGIGVDTEVFRSNRPHQWFLCMWTRRQRKKLQNRVREYDAVIVLGCVSATETVWQGLVTGKNKKVTQFNYSDKNIVLKRGEEMGRFNMGSTVIVLATDKMKLDEGIVADAEIKLGQCLALPDLKSID